MKQEKPLSTKVAVVTGGSRGIGRAIAHRLAADGAAVMIGARDEAAIAAVVDAIRNAGGQAAGLALDLRAPDGGARLVEAAESRFGRLDILINNAGDTRAGAFETLTDADFEAGFGLKFYAAVRATRAAWPALKAARGTVINIGGVGGRVPRADFAIGAAVNAAIMALTKSLAGAGMAHGIRVLAINPGSVETDRLRAAVQSFADREGIGLDEMLHRMAADAQTARLGRPEDIAAVAAFLVSPAAEWMTGTLLDVDGGAVKGL